MKRLLLYSLSILLLLCCSCVRNRPYRVHYVSGKANVDKVLVEKLKTREFDPLQGGEDEWPYQLGFIEFDDRGEMFHRGQLQQAVKAIEDAKKAAPANCPPVVAVFVHGWKNNASDSSGNVWGFRQMLAGLSAQYAKCSPVVGIYIGWRGAVVSAPLLKEFTFWDRMQKSQNLPGSHMVEALLSIMRAAKGPEYKDPTMSILIGHSFGGAVLETALSETLASVAVTSTKDQPIRWPASLVVFVNEAQEALRSYQLIESMTANLEPRRDCAIVDAQNRFQAPVIVSLSSTGDYATKAFFPFGQSVARPFNSLRSYPEPNTVGIERQTPMYFNTTAHMQEFQSHVFGAADDPKVIEALKQCKETDFAKFSKAVIKTTPDLAGVRYLVVDRPGALNKTPYWVMQMPASIVPDHSTIFTPVFRNVLLSFLFQIDFANPSYQQKK